MNIRFRTIWAVLKRNFRSYFSSPTGYVFITVFVVATGFVAFYGESFFAANVADLAALNRWMPWLLVIFVPAVTMGSWSEERKLGTHELLLTLPVRDIEVVLGKYLAALAVYTVSLAFSLAHALVLVSLGRPDPGLLLANYVGYWLLGAALIPLGLVASSLTSNTTVSFILGTAFCAATVLAEKLVALMLGPASRLARGLGLPSHFETTALGVISLADILFFVLMAAAMLYINTVMVGRRHWWGGRDGPHMGWHQLVRGLAVVTCAISVGLLAGRWMQRARMDATAEGLNSPAPQTVSLLKSLPGKEPVYVRAFVSRSEDVPEDYLPVRETLLRTLKTIQASAGNRVAVQIKETEPYTREARDAEEMYSIKAQSVYGRTEGRHRQRDVFLGVAVTCGPRQEVIPFFDLGVSVEYELARAIRTVAKAERRKVGILKTQAGVMGSMPSPMEMQMGMQPRQRPPWQIVEELRKQYEVSEVTAEAPIKDIDVLIAVQPGSLSPQQQAHVSNYVMSGRPILLFEDPLSLMTFNPMQPPMGGDDEWLLGPMGVAFNKDRIVCDASSRIETLPDVPEAYVFISETVKGFSRKEEITRDLSRLVMFYGGTISQSSRATTEFIPLLQTGTVAGLMDTSDALPMLMSGSRLGLKFPPGDTRYTMAARINGKAGKYTLQSGEPPSTQPSTQPTIEAKVNAIVVADSDLMSDELFRLRKTSERDLRFDNIQFVLNCVDWLAGDRDLIGVRSRHPHYRELETIDARRREYREQMLTEQKAAEDAAKKERDQAQKRFEEVVAEIDKRTDLDERGKEMLKEQVRQVEQKRLDAHNSEIDSRKQDRVQRAREEMLLHIRQIENQARRWAILLPSLPPILIGLVVFMLQQYRERRGLPLARSMRKTP